MKGGKKMPQRDKALLYTPLLGQVAPLPQHEKTDGSMALTGEQNPLPVQMIGGSTVQEQLTQDDATDGTLTFSETLNSIGIFNVDSTNTGVFNVNGINLTIPPNTPFEANIGGTPRKTVTVTGSTSYIVTRYG
jgi:hypothetical protein